jgi:hypothetical protein
LVDAIVCSLASAVGVEYEYRGKVYRWDFSEMFGPLWLGEDMEPLADQYRHHACSCWKAFSKWMAEWREQQAREASQRRLRKEGAARANMERVVGPLLRRVS